MQITLNQEEIEAAITAHVCGQINIAEDQHVAIDLKAGRGPEGYTAHLDIVKNENDVEPPTATDTTPAENPKPAKKVTAKKLTEKAPEKEVQAETVETQTEAPEETSSDGEGTGAVTTAAAPPKSIFSKAG